LPMAGVPNRYVRQSITKHKKKERRTRFTEKKEDTKKKNPKKKGSTSYALGRSCSTLK